MNLARRFSYRGRQFSYISARCPIPKRITAGFFPLARATFILPTASQHRHPPQLPRSLT
jgi:hypothetical protein